MDFVCAGAEGLFILIIRLFQVKGTHPLTHHRIDLTLMAYLSSTAGVTVKELCLPIYNDKIATTIQLISAKDEPETLSSIALSYVAFHMRKPTDLSKIIKLSSVHYRDRPPWSYLRFFMQELDPRGPVLREHTGKQSSDLRFDFHLDTR